MIEKYKYLKIIHSKVKSKKISLKFLSILLDDDCLFHDPFFGLDALLQKDKK